jgi:hypothetical protein
MKNITIFEILSLLGKTSRIYLLKYIIDEF